MEHKKLEHKIIVAGIGPGGRDYILPAALAVIESAEVLVGGARALRDFGREGQKQFTIQGDIGEVIDFIREEIQKRDVVAMVSGDPGYYSLLDALRRGFPVEYLTVIPGLSSMQLAFARIALPWHEARLLSFHGRRPSDAELLYERGRIIGTLTDTKYDSHTIPELLLSLGWHEDAELYVCAKLSYPEETIYQTTLGAAQEVPVVKSGILIIKA